MHSSAKPAQAWHRYYPKDQTVTIFGWMNSVKSLEGGSPLVTLDNYTVIGDLAGINETTANTFIEATGQFHAEDNADVFVLESWKVYDGYDEGYQGTLQREGEEIVLITMENQKLILPDVPPDVPLPLENVYVMGVTRGDTFEWKSFDMRMTEGGGGGGGGGIGFYKLNLTGTPMPLPTPQQELNQGTGEYVVQENDTRDSIAESYGMTTDELLSPARDRVLNPANASKASAGCSMSLSTISPMVVSAQNTSFTLIRIGSPIHMGSCWKELISRPCKPIKIVQSKSGAR
jgi:LysM repeat protein